MRVVQVANFYGPRSGGLRTAVDRLGLKGLSGGRDLRELEVAASGDETAQLALDVYTYRIAGAVAAMCAALGGLDAVAFTAGVGEHSRRPLCRLRAPRVPGRETRPRPERALDAGRRHRSPGSDVRVLVIAAHEELVAARAVRALLAAST